MPTVETAHQGLAVVRPNVLADNTNGRPETGAAVVVGERQKKCWGTQLRTAQCLRPCISTKRNRRTRG